jgi:DNA-binding XRE family transcriptional regulator
MRYHAQMTQPEYATFVGVSLKTLRNAEQGMDVSVATLNKDRQTISLKGGLFG